MPFPSFLKKKKPPVAPVAEEEVASEEVASEEEASPSEEYASEEESSSAEPVAPAKKKMSFGKGLMAWAGRR